MAKKNMAEVLMATTLEILAAECRAAGGIYDVPVRFCVSLPASGRVIALPTVLWFNVSCRAPRPAGDDAMAEVNYLPPKTRTGLSRREWEELKATFDLEVA